MSPHANPSHPIGSDATAIVGGLTHSTVDRMANWQSIHGRDSKHLRHPLPNRENDTVISSALSSMSQLPGFQSQFAAASRLLGGTADAIRPSMCRRRHSASLFLLRLFFFFFSCPAAGYSCLAASSSSFPSARAERVATFQDRGGH